MTQGGGWVLEEGQDAASPSATGLGSAVSSPVGSRAKPAKTDLGTFSIPYKLSPGSNFWQKWQCRPFNDTCQIFAWNFGDFQTCKTLPSM